MNCKPQYYYFTKSMNLFVKEWWLILKHILGFVHQVQGFGIVGLLKGWKIVYGTVVVQLIERFYIHPEGLGFGKKEMHWRMTKIIPALYVYIDCAGNFWNLLEGRGGAKSSCLVSCHFLYLILFSFPWKSLKIIKVGARLRDFQLGLHLVDTCPQKISF